MTEKFYVGLTVALMILALTTIVAPRLRLRQQEKRRGRLEDWYASGPTHEGSSIATDAFRCDLCSGTQLRKALYGTYERRDLLKRLSPAHVDEAKFYEYRCAKCGSLAVKEKALNAPFAQG